MRSPNKLKLSTLQFICRQSRLTELAIQVEDNDDTVMETQLLDERFGKHLDEVAFQLKKLGIHKSPFFLGTIGNFTKFIDKVGPTLETLELGNIIPHAQDGYQQIFAKCHKLRVLDILIGFAPKTLKFYRKLTSNCSLNQLFVRGYNKLDEKALKGIIWHAAGLEILNIHGDDISKGLLRFISCHLPKLKQLYAGLSLVH